MDFDVEDQLRRVERSVSSTVREGRSARAITLSRSYATTVDDLWDAVTNGERIARWFLPISGELEQGGRYQLEGNAGGLVTACERPSYLALTWEFGGDVSWVEVRFAGDESGCARLALTHTAHLSEHWDTYGPGVAGVGWELSLMGLALHLAQPAKPKLDEAEAGRSRVRRFTGRQGAHRGKQRGVGAGSHRGWNRPHRRPCRGTAHHHVLYGGIRRA